MELNVLLETFIQTIAAGLQIDRCLLIGSKDQVSQIFAIVEHSLPLQIFPKIVMDDYNDVSHRIVQTVVQSISSVVISDLTVAAAQDLDQDDYWDWSAAKSIACLPVVSDNIVLAVLYLEHRRDRFEFTQERLRLMQGLCDQLAISLAHLAQCQRLLTYTQSLETQVSNQCYLSGLEMTFDEPINLDGMGLETRPQHNPSRMVRLSERKFRQLVENANDLIFSITLDGRFTYLSPKFQEMCGYEPAQFMGRSFSFLAHPEDVAGMYAMLRGQLQKRDKLTGFECRIRHRDGHYIWIISNHSAPIEDETGQLIGFQGIVRDITDRKRAELELKQTKDRLQFLLSATTAVIFSLELLEVPVVTYVSDNVDQLIGLSSEFFLRQPQTWVERIHPEDLPLLQRMFSKTIRERTQCRYEYRFLDGNQKYRWIYNEIILLSDEQGCPIEAVGYAADVSDRKQADARLQLMNEQLLISNAELARATRLKDEFLANMSHELRTPLNSILGISEAMLEQPYGPLAARYQKSLRMIETSGEHLLDLINDILDLAKIEAGRLEIEIGETSIYHLCQSSINFVKQLAINKGLKLDFRILTDFDIVQADERRLCQVLINLLSNAVKFTPSGGTIELVVEVDLTWKMLLFRVKDSGIGIAKDKIPQLFQPFMQIDSSLCRQYSGTGLGLALVKRIIDLHGGSVMVTSQEHQGSCFTVGIPCEIVDAPPLPSSGGDQAAAAHLNSSSANLSPAIEARSTQQHSKQLSSPLVLLAEDNKMNIEMFSDYLDLHGYQLLIAQDGVEAVELAKLEQPHLILMDIQMPRMDGLEAIRQIRQEATLSTTPIVALTALAMPGDAQKCLEAGANDYLSKPVKLKELVTLMQMMLPVG